MWNETWFCACVCVCMSVCLCVDKEEINQGTE